VRFERPQKKVAPYIAMREIWIEKVKRQPETKSSAVRDCVRQNRKYSDKTTEAETTSPKPQRRE